MTQSLHHVKLSKCTCLLKWQTYVCLNCRSGKRSWDSQDSNWFSNETLLGLAFCLPKCCPLRNSLQHPKAISESYKCQSSYFLFFALLYKKSYYFSITFVYSIWRLPGVHLSVVSYLSWLKSKCGVLPTCDLTTFACPGTTGGRILPLPRVVLPADKCIYMLCSVMKVPLQGVHLDTLLRFS